MRWDDLPRKRQRRGSPRRRRRLGGGGGGGMPIGAGGLGIGGMVVLGLIGWALGIDPRLLIGGAEILMGGGRSYSSPIAAVAEQVRAAPDRRPTRSARFVSARARQHRGAVEGHLHQGRPDLSRRRELVMFSRRDPLGLRHGAERDGAVLLPERPGGLSRHLVLPRSRDAASAAATRQGLPVLPGLCDRPRGRPSRAEPARHPAQGAAGAARRSSDRATPIACRCRSSCRPTASPASGRTTPKRSGSFIDPGDIEAALQTASAIGDDTLQRQTHGYVVPDSFTHGSSEQRKRWFSTGFKEGTVKACNTFRTANG